MTNSILICDDSSFARKQIAKILPKSWSPYISFAENGEIALDFIRKGEAELLFLDLNMPVLDGYQVLKKIREEDLESMVIVISGDIQPEAHKRVMTLGALDFIKKPIDKQNLITILSKYGIEIDEEPDQQPSKLQNKTSNKPTDLQVKSNQWDSYKEIANIAIGQAAELLARLLNVFIKMPLPKVKLIKAEELKRTFQLIDKQQGVSAVCQGFSGSGIAGEAILIFNQSSFKDIAELMQYQGKLNDLVEIDLLLDIGSVMISAFLKGISDQLDINFSHSNPIVISKNEKLATTLTQEKPNWKNTLAIELQCSIENKNIKCNVLLLFTEDSLAPLNDIVEILAG